MPMNLTRSPLARKYGQEAVVKARNIVAKEKGFKTVTESNSKKLPWGIIGYIAKYEKESMERKKKQSINEMSKLKKKK